MEGIKNPELVCSKDKYDRFECRPKDKNLVIIELSGGAYEDYWYEYAICRKDKLKDLEEEFREIRESEVPNIHLDDADDVEKVIRKHGCVPISFRDFKEYYEGREWV